MARPRGKARPRRRRSERSLTARGAPWRTQRRPGARGMMHTRGLGRRAPPPARPPARVASKCVRAQQPVTQPPGITASRGEEALVPLSPPPHPHPSPRAPPPHPRAPHPAPPPPPARPGPTYLGYPAARQLKVTEGHSEDGRHGRRDAQHLAGHGRRAGHLAQSRGRQLRPHPPDDVLQWTGGGQGGGGGGGGGGELGRGASERAASTAWGR